MIKKEVYGLPEDAYAFPSQVAAGMRYWSPVEILPNNIGCDRCILKSFLRKYGWGLRRKYVYACARRSMEARASSREIVRGKVKSGPPPRGIWII